MDTHSDRIIGYDFARAIALFGMLAVNYWVLADNIEPESKWLTDAISIIHGRAAATFVVLSGVGLSLFSRGAHLGHFPSSVQTCRGMILKRSCIFFIMGIAFASIWPSDILHFYAVFFFLGSYLLTTSSLRLWLPFLFPIALFSLHVIVNDFDRGWDWDIIMNYKDLLNIPGLLRHLFYEGCYPVFPWISFLVLGLWLGKLDMSDRVLRRHILFMSISVISITEYTSWKIFSSTSILEHIVELDAFLPWFEINPLEPMPLFVFSAGASALVIICLSLILAEKYHKSDWLLPFVAVGQMTLTLYIAHIFVGILALKILERYNMASPLFPLWGTLSFYLASLFFSHFWLKRSRKGPLELLVRRFSRFSIPSKTHTYSMH